MNIVSGDGCLCRCMPYNWITIFPMKSPLSMYSKAAGASSKSNTRSINGRTADKNIHRFEVFTRPYIDATGRSVDPHDCIGRQIAAVARQSTDQCDVASIGEYLQCLGQGIPAADIKHLVNAVATTDLLHFQVPVRVAAIICRADGTHFHRAPACDPLNS